MSTSPTHFSRPDIQRRSIVHDSGVEAAHMRKRNSRPPCRKIVLKLPDLDHAKSAVHNSLSSPHSRRKYKFIAPRNTIDYYKSVLRSNEAAAESSVRMFMAPGMDHCAGGAGPSHFNMTTALTDWVERGKAPEMILAAHLPDEPTGPHGPDRTRPLCAYPRVAKYKGTGSTDEAASFACTKE